MQGVVLGREYLGGFHPYDGTIDFYNRIDSILTGNERVLNLGAGRGSWFYLDQSEKRRSLLDIANRVKEFVGADIDPEVLANKTTHRNFLISGDLLPFEDNYFDVVICDWVFEHIENQEVFTKELNRVLKPNGLLAARTPHTLNVTHIAQVLIPEKFHSFVLRRVQPNRELRDHFKIYYRLNTRKVIRKKFPGYKDFTYLHVSEPGYYFNKRRFYKIIFYSQFLFPILFSNLHVFLQKPENLNDR